MQRECNVCGNEFPRSAEHWHKQPKAADGFSETCKTCARARARAQYEANKEAHKVKKLAWRAAHPESRRGEYVRLREKILDYQHRYYDENAEMVKARSKVYAESNPEKISERNFNAYWRDPDAERAKVKAYKAANRDKVRASNVEYRARKKDAPGFCTASELELQRAEQGNRCYWCSRDLTSLEFTVDHYWPLSRGGTNWPANVVLACCSCNSAKKDKHPEEFLASLWLSRRRRS